MKKFALGAIAAIVATVSLSTVAEAGWRHRHHHNHGWNAGVFFAPSIVLGPSRVVYEEDYCFTKKVRRYDDWGNVYIKRVRVCR